MGLAARKAKTKRSGRPNIIGQGAGYIPAKFKRSQINKSIDLPDGRAAAIRTLVDASILTKT